MTQMTVLHFASPFAFSVPLPTRSTAAVPRNAATAKDEVAGATAAPDADAALAPSGVDRVSLLAMDAPPAAIDGAGSDESLLDTVLRRYGEQRSPDPQDGPATSDEDASS